jgi:hypothetical protein
MSPPAPADINPYASPIAASANAPFESERPRFRILAVVVGCLVDIVASTVAAVAFGMVAAVFLVMQGARLERMQHLLADSPAMRLGGLLIGACGSILGGYVAAWMARQRELHHALATGIASLTIGIAMLLLQFLSPIPVTQPVWITVIAFMLTVPAAILGGWLRRKVVSRKRK